MIPIRRKARQVAMQILYQFDTQKSLPSPEELHHQMRAFFGHFETPVDSQLFCSELVSFTILNIKEIDEWIEKHLKDWKLERLNSIDRAILRIGIAELKYFKDIPIEVTIDESIELAKEYGSEESYRFVNGVLDAVSKIESIRKGKNGGV